MDKYKLHRPERAPAEGKRLIHIVELFAAIAFVLIVMYLVR